MAIIFDWVHCPHLVLETSFVLRTYASKVYLHAQKGLSHCDRFSEIDEHSIKFHVLST